MPAAVLHDVLSAAARRLRDAGLDAADAAADVDVLARHVLGWDRARLLAHRRDAVPPAFVEPLRRARRSPRRSRPGRLPDRHARVLRPRLRGHARRADPAPRNGAGRRGGARGARGARVASGRAVDVGTGSGCIAVAIAVDPARCRPSSPSIDRATALAVARRNARRHGVGDRVALVAGDLLTALSPRRAVDVVVSNPPYVPDGSPDVAVDVARHEPACGALRGSGRPRRRPTAHRRGGAAGPSGRLGSSWRSASDRPTQWPPPRRRRRLDRRRVPPGSAGHRPRRGAHREPIAAR